MQIGAVKLTIAQNYDELKESWELLQFIDAAKQFTETSLEGKNEALEGIVEFANNLGMAVDLVNSVRGAHTDGELAYNLGQVLWNNSKVGGIVNALYGFVFKGDNEGMAKFVMYAICPEAAVPELVAQIRRICRRAPARNGCSTLNSKRSIATAASPAIRPSRQCPTDFMDPGARRFHR